MTTELPGNSLADRLLDRRIALALFILATALSCVYILATEPGRYDEEPRVGIHLAMGHGFRTSLDLSPTAEVTAWVPPLYPAVCAAVFKLLGSDTLVAKKSLLMINALGYGFIVAGALHLGRLVFSRPVGLLAAIGVLLNPLFILRTNYFWHTYIAQAGLIWLIIAAILVQRSGPTFFKLLLIGGAFGLLVQFNGSFVFAAPVVGWIAVRKTPLVKQFAFAAVAAIAFAVVIAPWTIRNYVVFDKIMYLRRGAELEMWIGNLRGSSGWQDLTIHPSVYPPEKKIMLELGEEKYFALCGQRFKDEFEHDPSAYYIRCLRRIGYMFVGPMKGDNIRQIQLSSKADLARFCLDWAVFLPGILGLGLAWKQGYKFLWILPLAFLSCIPYIISHMNYRFTIHIKLLMTMAAAFLLWSIWQRLRTGRLPRAE